jgi:hypothetical protein
MLDKLLETYVAKTAAHQLDLPVTLSSDPRALRAHHVLAAILSTNRAADPCVLSLKKITTASGTSFEVVYNSVNVNPNDDEVPATFYTCPKTPVFINIDVHPFSVSHFGFVDLQHDIAFTEKGEKEATINLAIGVSPVHNNCLRFAVTAYAVFGLAENDLREKVFFAPPGEHNCVTFVDLPMANFADVQALRTFRKQLLAATQIAASCFYDYLQSDDAFWVEVPADAAESVQANVALWAVTNSQSGVLFNNVAAKNWSLLHAILVTSCRATKEYAPEFNPAMFEADMSLFWKSAVCDPETSELFAGLKARPTATSKNTLRIHSMTMGAYDWLADGNVRTTFVPALYRIQLAANAICSAATSAPATFSAKKKVTLDDDDDEKETVNSLRARLDDQTNLNAMKNNELDKQRETVAHQRATIEALQKEREDLQKCKDDQMKTMEALKTQIDAAQTLFTATKKAVKAFEAAQRPADGAAVSASKKSRS